MPAAAKTRSFSPLPEYAIEPLCESNRRPSTPRAASRVSRLSVASMALDEEVVALVCVVVLMVENVAKEG